MNLFGIVTIGSLVLYLLVGLYCAKSTNNTEDFYVMGRSCPAYLITGTLIATNIGSVTFIGYVGSVYTNGSLPYITMFGATVTSSLILGLFVGRYIRRMHLFTVPDFFTMRYPGNEAVKVFSTAIVLFTMLIYLVAVCQGVNVVLCDIFGLSQMMSQFIILSVVTIFTMAGGMKGVVITDTIMFAIFFIAAMLVVPYIIQALGGWPEGVARAAEKLPYAMEWNGAFSKSKGFWQHLEVNLASVVLAFASPQLLSRAFIAKSEKAFGQAMILQAILFPIFIFTLLYFFSWFPAVKTDIAPTSAFTWVAMTVAPPVIGSIAIAGIAAAALSSASSMFQQAAAALSRDIYERYINPSADERRKLFISRLSVLLIAIACFIAGSMQKITALGLVYGFLFASAGWAAWAPSLLLGIFWKRATTKAAVWSMSTGFISALTFILGRTWGFTPAWVPPNLVGVTVATAVFFLVAVSDRTTERELEVYNLMRAPDPD
ncbi:sodium:solute symporter family protein [Synergistaceae bacterium OttesenSCG-928-I11]|nr:sodium:solute symporter family protein [Synergistaceae bacterium OttesenSCG-928-I11]